jgi:hypothetical protein
MTRVAWLLVAVGAGTVTSGLALNVLGGAEVVAIRRAVGARIARRPAPTS